MHWSGTIISPRWRPRQPNVSGFLRNSNVQVYLRLIWSIIIKLLSDLYSNMRALFGIQALQVSSRRNWTQFNDGSVKLFSMTGLTMTPVPFLGYLVSTKDDKNSAKNSFSNLLVILITVCITYCRACVIPLSPIVWDMQINIQLSLPRLQNLKIHLFVTDFHIIS